MCACTHTHSLVLTHIQGLTRIHTLTPTFRCSPFRHPLAHITCTHAYTRTLTHATQAPAHTFVHTHTHASDTLTHTHLHTPTVRSLTRRHAPGLTLTLAGLHLHTHSRPHSHTLPPAVATSCSGPLFSNVRQVQWEVRQPPGYYQRVPPRPPEGEGQCGSHSQLWR